MREIDWSTAVVEDGRLTVELTGEPDREWSSHFLRTIALLERGERFGEISAGKRRVRVQRVEPGMESDLHHLLQSAVQQANADVDAEHPDEEEEAGTGTSGPDAQMTDAFRGFAPGDGD